MNYNLKTLLMAESILILFFFSWQISSPLNALRVHIVIRVPFALLPKKNNKTPGLAGTFASSPFLTSSPGRCCWPAVGSASQSARDIWDSSGPRVRRVRAAGRYQRPAARLMRWDPANA